MFHFFHFNRKTPKVKHHSLLYRLHYLTSGVKRLDYFYGNAK
jgi:hypothetical protein